MPDEPTSTDAQPPDDAAPEEPLDQEAAEESEEAAAWAELRAAAEGTSAQPAEDLEDEPEEGDGQAADDQKGGDDDAPADDSAADIWAEAPDELKAAFEAERKRAAAAEHGRKSAEGRLQTLRGRMDSMMAEPPSSRQKTDDSQQTAQELAKEWQSFQEDYPDIAKPVERMLGMFRSQIDALGQDNQQLRSTLQALGEDRHAAVADTMEAEVKERHSDYDDIADSEQFVQWAGRQGRAMKLLIQENAEYIANAEDVDFILTRYKSDQGIESGGGKPSQQESTTATRRFRQRTNTGAPRPSPGARVATPRRASTETEEDVWAELRERARAATR